MSRKYVRDTVRNWIAALPSPASPFYETINVDENPTDLLWYTVDFQSEFTSTSTYCDQKEEQGVIDFVFSGAPGVGDSAVISAAESVVDAFMKNKDPTGKLSLQNVLAPDEFSGGTANKYYQVIVGVEYLYLFD
jgi:hypothetical protein